MKLSNKMLAAVVLGTLAAASPVGAVQIDGDIKFVGGVDLNGSIGAGGTATAISTVWFNQVAFSDGDYAPLTPGTSVPMNAFSFGPPLGTVNGGAGVNPLWSVTVNVPSLGGLITYSFDLDPSITVSMFTLSGLNFLSISGLGTASITGGTTSYDDTWGSWAFSTQTASNNGGLNEFFFTFSADQNVPPVGVPDGGTTLALLGGALVMAGSLRRKA